LAADLVEGGAPEPVAEVQRLLFAEPELAHQLLAKCADVIASYLPEQVRAGADAAMLFDTWAGILSPGDYATFALPYARRVFEAVGAAACETLDMVTAEGGSGPSEGGAAKREPVASSGLEGGLEGPGRS